MDGPARLQPVDDGEDLLGGHARLPARDAGAAAIVSAAAASHAQLQRIEAQLAAVTEKAAALAPAVDALDEREHAYRSLQIRLDKEKQLHDMVCKQEQLFSFLHSYAQAADNARTQLAALTRDYDIQTEQISRIEEEKKAAGSGGACRTPRRRKPLSRLRFGASPRTGARCNTKCVQF